VSILKEIEEQSGRSREQWTLEQWRKAAERLAEIVDERRLKKRGRPALAGWEKDNVAALSFWAEEEQAAALAKGARITIKESIRRVIQQAAQREGKNQGRVRQKMDSATKQVRSFRASQKKRK
jgi:hypothetical protein